MPPGSLPITIIIPCYNDGDTLVETVATTRLCDVTDVIIVDDGSTDEATLKVLKRFEAGGVTVLRTENQGAAAARNHALREVVTPYVFNLDADDQLLPGALWRLYDALMADPELRVAWGDYYVFGQWDRLQETADCIDPWQVTILNDLPVSALFRTETLRQVGGWQAEGYEDWDLWMALADRGIKGTRVGAAVFRYRIRPVELMRRRVRDEMRHEVLMANMRARHSRLFAGRRRALRRSCAPWHVRVALLLADMVPLKRDRRVRFLWRVNQLTRGRVRRMHLRRPEPTRSGDPRRPSA